MLKGLWFFVTFGYRTDKRYILYLFLQQFVRALQPIANVIMPKYILDELAAQARLPHLAAYVGILLGANLLVGWFGNWLGLESFSRRCAVGGAFDQMLHEKLSQVDYIHLESADFLDMKERANKFLYADWHGFSYLLDSALALIGQVFILAGILAIVLSLSPLIVAAFILLVLLCAGYEMRIKRKQAALNLDVAAAQRGVMVYSRIFEDAQYGKEIRVNDCGAWLAAKERGYYDTSLQSTLQQNRLLEKSSAVDAVGLFLQQGLAYGYLIRRFLLGGISLGDFMMYAGAAGSFSAAIRTVMHSVVDILTYAPYYEALEAYLGLPTHLRETGTLLVAPGVPAITFEHVSFRYPGQTADALHDISFTMQPGMRLAVVGENGAGKTTLIKLLLRIYAPTGGRICVGGRDIMTYAHAEYRKALSAVLQDFALFPLTLKENICLNQTETTGDAQVMALLQQVGLAGRVATLPKGIHTSIHKTLDPDGFEPSGGEGQKIALARALFRKAPIVILDEPTAALDPRAEREMYRRFDALIQGSSAVYISHRLSSTRFCDKIMVLAQGRVVQWGHHDELVAVPGLYRELFQMQASLYLQPARREP